ncbi:hypothetical protein MKP08_00610 [Erythrobacter sp. LQ02-29]|uniref:hypothetical protein n=1 Tax=Erythrobacter sp. LQ02-29 TaxID=2920384 RepID=UPI001F4E4EFA|nr:hypothetical protein [Erythrobacter sp. LQ02-29]MCP9221251.1 hypothetical protein [Erythrobacter sp. LQ02-29]
MAMARTGRSGRLERIARLRAVDRLRAAESVATSGEQFDRLALLAERSRQLVNDYDSPEKSVTGGMLTSHLAFRGQLAALSHRTRDDAREAERRVEAARGDLAAADRRSEIVDERLRIERRNQFAAAERKDWHGT